MRLYLVLWGLTVVVASLVTLFFVPYQGEWYVSFLKGVTCGSALALGVYFIFRGVSD